MTQLEKMNKLLVDGLELIGFDRDKKGTAFYAMQIVNPHGKGMEMWVTDIKYVPPYWKNSKGNLTKPRWEIKYIVQSVGSAQTSYANYIKVYSIGRLVKIVDKVFDIAEKNRKKWVEEYGEPDTDIDHEFEYFWDSTEDGQHPANRESAVIKFGKLNIPKKHYIDAKWKELFGPLSEEDKDKLRWGLRRVMQMMDYVPDAPTYHEELIVRSYDNREIEQYGGKSGLSLRSTDRLESPKGDENMAIEGESVSVSVFPEPGAKSFLFSAEDNARKKKIVTIGLIVLAGVVALKLFYKKV